MKLEPIMTCNRRMVRSTSACSTWWSSCWWGEVHAEIRTGVVRWGAWKKGDLPSDIDTSPKVPAA